MNFILYLPRRLFLSMMLRYKMVTFDARGVLMKVRKSVGHHYAKAAKKYSLDINEEEVNRLIPICSKEQMKNHPNFGATSGITSEEWWTDVVRNVFTSCGVQNDDKLLQVAHELYTRFSTDKTWEIFPDVKETLSFLNMNGICLGVLSNTDERLIDILQSLEIAHHFTFILPSVYFKTSKPDKKFFDLALDRMKLSGEDCAHIGNDVYYDYKGATSAGMDGYLIDRDGKIAKDYPQINQRYILQDLSEIEQRIFV